MKKRNVFSAVLALMLLLGAVQPALAAETAATMKLSATEGTVTVTNASGRSLTVRDDMRLSSGYQVETSDKSYAWINLDNTKLMKLDANTKVEIRKSGKQLELLLKSGNMYGDVSKPLEEDETLDIRTSTAIVGIRGTKFSVTQVRSENPGPEGAPSDPEAGPAERWTTRVQVYEGTVAVKTQQEIPETPEAPPVVITTTVTAGIQLTVDPGAEKAEVFEKTPLSGQDVSGCAAVELVKDPNTLEQLEIDLSAETARELLERDQAEAERQQAAANAGRTGLEAEAAPDVVWGGGNGSTSSGGGGSSSRPTPTPQPEITYTVTFDPNGGSWDGSTTAQSAQTDSSGKLAGGIPADPALRGGIFNGWNTAADGSGAAIAPASYTFTADTDLYAQWLSTTVQVDRELVNHSQEAAQQKIQELLNNPNCTQVTVELTEYTVPYEGNETQVIILYLKDALTVPEGKELVMNCYFQVGSNDSYSDKSQEPDGRARATGDLTVNGTLTVNNGMSLCTGSGVGVSTITIGSTGTLADNTPGTNEIIGNVDNRGTLRIADAAGGWQLSSGSIATSFTNSGILENQGTFTSLSVAINNQGRIKNSGTFTSNEAVNNSGTIDNTGSMETGGGVTNTGTFINGSGAAFKGTAIVPGYDAPAIRMFFNDSGAKIENEGTFTLEADCTFTNSGSVESSGNFTGSRIGNDGDFTNKSGGTLRINGELTNSGTFMNSGTVTTAGGAKITNSGTFQLDAGSQVTIDARFENTNMVTITGDSTSPSVFSSNSTSGSGGVDNQAEGRIVIGAFGRFENNDSAGGVTNAGAITIHGGGILTTNNKFTNTTAGTITNDGTYYGPALTGGTIAGINAGQITAGNPEPGEGTP